MLIIFALTLCGLWTTAAGAAGTVASALTITTPLPAALTWVVGMDKEITYSVTLAPTEGGIGTTGIIAFFSSADDATKSADVTATGTTTTSADDDTAITGIIAEMMLDATNCDAYTKFCTTLAGPDSTTCVDFGDMGGAKYCSAVVAATAFAVTLPDPTSIKYSTTTATVVTFSLTVTEAAGLAGSLTAINLYFSDNAQFDMAVKKSGAVLATSSDLPKDITLSADTTISGATASLMPDAANCGSYTHLCAVITVAADSGVTTDDDFCIPLTAVTAGAGVTDCPADESGIGMNKGSAVTILVLALAMVASTLM